MGNEMPASLDANILFSVSIILAFVYYVCQGETIFFFFFLLFFGVIIIFTAMNFLIIVLRYGCCGSDWIFFFLLGGSILNFEKLCLK